MVMRRRGPVEQPLVHLAFNLRYSSLKSFDEAAESLGLGRSEALRRAIERWLKGKREPVASGRIESYRLDTGDEPMVRTGGHIDYDQFVEITQAAKELNLSRSAVVRAAVEQWTEAVQGSTRNGKEGET